MEDITLAIIILAHLRENGYSNAHIQNGVSLQWPGSWRQFEAEGVTDYETGYGLQSVQIGLERWKICQIIPNPQTLNVFIDRLGRVADPPIGTWRSQWSRTAETERKLIKIGSMHDLDIMEKIVEEIETHMEFIY